jgi:hypothetical protein
MPEPEQHREGPPTSEADRAPESDEGRRQADEDFWQWVALVVLLACWLAEARI